MSGASPRTLWHGVLVPFICGRCHGAAKKSRVLAGRGFGLVPVFQDELTIQPVEKPRHAGPTSLTEFTVRASLVEQ